MEDPWPLGSPKRPPIDKEKLMPTQVRNHPRADLRPEINECVLRDIESDLISDAWSDIKQIEYLHGECRMARFVQNVEVVDEGDNFDWRTIVSPNTDLLRTERWFVDRCGDVMPYLVKYYKKNDDFFNTSVYPETVSDLPQLARCRVKQLARHLKSRLKF